MAQLTNVAVVVKGAEGAGRILRTLLNGEVKMIMPRALLMELNSAEWEYNVYGQASGQTWIDFLGVLTHDVVRDNLVSMSTTVDG